MVGSRTTQDRQFNVIDLRSAKEIEAAGAIPRSIHIPLDKLRTSLDNLDKGKDYVPYCAVGMRGYLGHRILTQHGFKSRNLSGGYRTFVGAVEELMRECGSAGETIRPGGKF